MKQQIDRSLTDQILEGIDFEMWEALRREQKERGFRTMGDCLSAVLSEGIAKHAKARGDNRRAAQFQAIADEIASNSRRRAQGDDAIDH